MFKQIVVGVDGQPGGRDATELAKNLAANSADITLAHIYPGDPHIRRGAGGAYEAAARTRAGELLKRSREEARIDAHLRWHGSPSPGRGLHELCDELDADLLVVGSSRRGLLGRVLIGDDTQSALNGAPCAIAIAPAGYLSEPVAMREIGVGYDGSPESEHALDVARELARRCDAKLSAFQAASLPAIAYSGAMLSLGEAVEALVEEARSNIEGLGDVEPHAAFGQPAEELSVYSASLDLLIVGSRGYGPLGRLIYGSTSGQLARTARCPLLVLPRAASTTELPEDADENADVVAAS